MYRIAIIVITTHPAPGRRAPAARGAGRVGRYYTIYHILYTIYYILYTIYYILYTIYYTIL